MMSFEEFANAVVRRMEARLGDRYSVSVHEALRNNSTVQPQLVIKENGRLSGPAIYLEDQYERYSQIPCSEQMDRILDNISRLIEQQDEALAEMEQCGDFLTDYQQVKEKILFKLVNTKDNEKMLMGIPHIPYLDLSIVFYIFLSETEEGIMTANITNRHMEFWGVTADELYQAAQINTPEKMPVRFCSMLDIFAEMTGLSKEDLAGDWGEDMFQIQGNDDASQLYVLSNQAGIGGAAAILYPGTLKTCAEALKKNLYIIPSSVHEVLLAPYDEKTVTGELAEMIQYINREEVAREDWLSDHAYFYNYQDDSVIAV